jgi:hypothetical protein
MYCIPTADIGDADLARLRELRLPNQNASPVSAIAPTAPTAAPAIQACGPLLPVVVVVVGIVAPKDVEELDEVVDGIGEAFEEVAAVLGGTKINSVENEVAVAVIICREGVIVSLEELEMVDVVIAAMGRLRYSVCPGQFFTHQGAINVGPPSGKVWYIVIGVQEYPSSLCHN